MKIVLAPHMPILANGSRECATLHNLSLLSLPNYVTLIVPENWCQFLSECNGIASDYELFSMLLELPVQEVQNHKKAEYIKLNPDILSECDSADKETARQQLFAMWQLANTRRIYAGTKCPAVSFGVTVDGCVKPFIHHVADSKSDVKALIDSFEPKLVQLKHFKDGRKDGDKIISPFSAYDKNDDSYARRLLKQAYEEHLGDIDETTYLYTYDAKNKTFVQFRPDRGNTYHGMDIDIERARIEAPGIVRLYHK